MTRQFSSLSQPGEPKRRRLSLRTRFTPVMIRHWYRQRKFCPAFWTITGILSLVVNGVLLLTLYFVGKELFAIKAVLSDQLIGGLHENFVKMDQAVIAANVQVNDTIRVDDTIVVQDTIPVQFSLPVQTNTDVVLTANTPIKNATVTIVTPYFTLTNAPTDIILPAGTRLPVALDIVVPVDTTIPVVLNVPVGLDVPVALNVPVNIPLNQTELHEPFVGLQEVVGPYKTLLSSAPSSWEEALCGAKPGLLCGLVRSEDQ